MSQPFRYNSYRSGLVLLLVLSAIGKAPEDCGGGSVALAAASRSVALRARSTASLLRVLKAIGHTALGDELELGSLEAPTAAIRRTRRGSIGRNNVFEERDRAVTHIDGATCIFTHLYGLWRTRGE